MIRAEWDAAEYGAAHRELFVLGGKAVDEVHDLLFGENAPARGEPQAVLRAAFDTVSMAPGGELLLALWVYGLCLQKWEKTEDYRRIRNVLAGLDAVHVERERERRVAGHEAELVSLLVRQAGMLYGQMGVEEAVNCSCPVATGERARGVVAGLTPIVTDLNALSRDELGGDLAEVRDVIRNHAVANATYFERIAEAADMVLRFVESPAVPAGLAEAIDALKEAEADPDLAAGVFASELRAHRASLEGLRDLAGAPQLRIDDGEVVYVYPFTLAPMSLETTDESRPVPTDIVDRARGDEVVGALTRAGFEPATVAELEVNDLWIRGDSSEPGYSGASIELPDLVVETTAYEWLGEDELHEALVDLSVEVRLSRLGNHYVRVRTTLEAAGLHDVNQALRRGSRAMGAEKLALEGEAPRWDRLPDFAEDVIRTIAEALGSTPVRNVNAAFHVVLTARSISVLEPGTERRAEGLADLEGSGGATLLFHPVRHLATSLEEWVRYPSPTVVNLLEGEGYSGDVVARSDNTTVLFMPSSPEWLIAEYQEMVEFVASLPPLLTLGAARARDATTEVENLLERQVVPELRRVYPSLESEPAAANEPTSGAADPIGLLYLKQMRIRALDTDIADQFGFLKSPALCRTRAHRRFLDGLWAAAGLPVLERELDRQLRLLAEQYERIAVMVSLTDERYRREQQRRSESLQVPVQIALGLLAAASLVGVFQWVNDAFGIEAALALMLETAALFLIALAIGAVIFRAGRS